ncbi:uncharacterized protein LOC107640826 [Arachis ipaensis]|uniref:uncharacterized protein LOC107640826 n=1 Tax=Arachis ipaensis TaxID=130454 RepID=UPI0007AEEB89|nr:uncharacterized protein LOC107640826 [Arachis ipaensis]XP_025652747.1 uncharacterized protein LOC112748719 [Arachis hypogaea]
MVKDLKNKYRLDMLGLIEMKRQVVTRIDVASIWGQHGAGWEYIGSNGAAGGLLIIWDDLVFKMNNCYKGERWLCVEGVLIKSSFNCAFFLVYGAHNRDEKIHVWEELRYMAGLCQVPCCYMGDFNEIVHVEERQCTTVLPRSAEEFKDWIQDMHLVDLPLTDHKFTWFRGRSCSRIDRALVILEWIEEFPESQLRGGQRGLPDHCPIIVEDKKIKGGPRPFRSLDSWFTHEGFLRMVKEEWRGLGDIQFTEKLKALTIPLGRWHKANFGDIDKKLKVFEEEIKKIDDMVSNGVYDGTMEARRKALVRNQARINIAIREFYKDLYHQEHYPMVGFRDGLVSRIDQEDSEKLEVLPSAEEIKEAVWDCESSKALGCDGYNMNFIKKNGRISPLTVGGDRIELSHLQFADDIILFCPPEEETIKNYKRLLRCFELMSGLSINFDKSSLIPVNCDEQWVQRMCSLLGCKGDTLPVKYLGISLGANPRLVKTWKPIIDKVEEKLSLWKAKVLNKAGKLVLIKSALNSLSVYYLSLFKMPKAVAEKLISLQRRFLWSKEDDSNGMALVRWEVVQAPKKLGGLGIGDAMIRNTALLFKWWWRFAKEECLL